MQALISILIPAFNAARFVEEALRGVLAQSYLNWELILVEDGSNDGTSSLVGDFKRMTQSPVRYERNPKNMGVAATRNRLLDLASGEYVAFLDADDVWFPDHLHAFSAIFSKGADFAISGIQIWDPTGSKRPEGYLPAPDDLAVPLTSLFEKSFIQTSSCVALGRTLFEKVGGFDEALRIGEDREYWFRCLLAGASLESTGRVSCRYRKHSSSAMAQTMHVAEDTIHFYRKYRNEVSLPADRRRACLAQALESYGRLLRRSDPGRSRRVLSESLRLQPWRWRAAVALLPRSPFRLKLTR